MLPYFGTSSNNFFVGGDLSLSICMNQLEAEIQSKKLNHTAIPCSH